MINIIIKIVILFIFGILIYFLAKSFGDKKTEFKNIRSWMSLTREERSKLDEDEKRKSMKKRQLLLTKIRREYKQLKLKR